MRGLSSVPLPPSNREEPRRHLPYQKVEEVYESISSALPHLMRNETSQHPKVQMQILMSVGVVTGLSMGLVDIFLVRSPEGLDGTNLPPKAVQPRCCINFVLNRVS